MPCPPVILGSKNNDKPHPGSMNFTSRNKRPKKVVFHQKFQVPKIEVLNLTKAILGVGFLLHKPYIQII